LLSVSGTDARGHDLFLDFPGSGVAPSVVSGLDSNRDKTFFGRLAKGPWSLEHVYGDFFRNDPTGSYFSDPLVPGQFQEDSYSVTQLKFQDSFVDDTLHVSGRLFNGEYRYRSHLSYDGMAFSYPANGDWYGGELRLLSTAVRDHKLMVGMEVQQNTHADQFSLDLTDPANNKVFPSSSFRSGIYAQDEWRINDTLTSTLGLRVDRDYIIGSRLSPRIGLIWQAMPTTTVKALYGRAHRAPNVYENAYADDVAQVNNPDLKGETVNTMELVVDHLVGRNLTLHGSIYQWTFSGLISLGTDPITGLAQYQNGKTVEARGVELSADNVWGWGGRLRGSISYQNVKQEDHSFMPNSPQLMAKLNFSSPLASSGLLMGYELQYYSERQATDGASLPGYWLSNVNLVADKWAKGLDVSLGIYNLFDQRFQQPGSRINWQDAFTQEGIAARLKMNYRF
jgi:outer membrane receptor protein involved in Fe transport